MELVSSDLPETFEGSGTLEVVVRDCLCASRQDYVSKGKQLYDDAEAVSVSDESLGDEYEAVINVFDS